MNITLAFIRVLFFILSIFFITTYMISGPEGYTPTNFILGLLGGSLLGLALIGFDLLFKRFNLRSFNIGVLGLIFGYLIHPGFLFLSAFFGAGLLFAGVTGSCGLAMLMGKMPWNKKKNLH